MLLINVDRLLGNVNMLYYLPILVTCFEPLENKSILFVSRNSLSQYLRKYNLIFTLKKISFNSLIIAIQLAENWLIVY